MPPQGWHYLWLVAEILKFCGDSIVGRIFLKFQKEQNQ